MYQPILNFYKGHNTFDKRIVVWEFRMITHQSYWTI